VHWSSHILHDIGKHIRTLASHLQSIHVHQIVHILACIHTDRKTAQTSTTDATIDPPTVRVTGFDRLPIHHLPSPIDTRR